MTRSKAAPIDYIFINNMTGKTMNLTDLIAQDGFGWRKLTKP